MSDNNYDNEEEEDRLYFEGLAEEVPKRKNSKLPKVVEEYVKSAVEVSHYNEVPSAISFYVLLGQICKDMVSIPNGRRIDDTRVQFIWMQTSGTGKSTLYDFFGPVSRLTFDMLSDKYGVDFNTFAVKDITDAGLIGSMGETEEMVEDENGNISRQKVPIQLYGELEGSGLAAFDEFEYSGVFKTSNHKENVVLYLNTFMNSLHGENWIITKKLKEGDVMECRCQRSLFATTYIPKQLTAVIAEKGVMQRTLIYIREVPQEIQDELRDAIIDEVGTIVNRDVPVAKFATGFVKIYDALKKHYDDSGQDALRTITFSPAFNSALKNESWKMRNFVSDSRPAVFEIASNFITRLNGTMTRMAVLSCIAEAPNIRDKSKRYIVTERHVRQAAYIVRQCYKSLVSWLDSSLKERPQGLQAEATKQKFIKTYQEILNESSDTEGWINKTTLLTRIRKQTGISQATLYRDFKKIAKENFENKRIGKYSYIKEIRSEQK
tara:strand:+ start:333 stop:1808 length:1476 start_codon:yes stop_codon:yes gene_type:complete